MGAVCPACGIAVVPGYVKCPRCHRPLPRIARSAANPTGTALAPEPRRFPIAPLVIAVAVAVGIVAVFAVRRGDHKPVAPAEPSPATVAVGPDPRPTPSPAPTAAVADQPAAAARPAPETVAARLERSLKHSHLWSTVEVVGNHADVRSGSCNDPGMTAALDGARAQFKASGLTRVRCLEQSGVVVFARDL